MRITALITVGLCVLGLVYFYASPWAVRRFSNPGNNRVYDGLDWVVVDDSSLASGKRRLLVKKLKLDSFRVRLVEGDLRLPEFVGPGGDLGNMDFILIGASFRISRDFSSKPRTLVFFYPDDKIASFESLNAMPDFVVIEGELGSRTPWVEFCEKNRVPCLLSSGKDLERLVDDLLQLVRWSGATVETHIIKPSK